jgi:hypothetical protein
MVVLKTIVPGLGAANICTRIIMQTEIPRLSSNSSNHNKPEQPACHVPYLAVLGIVKVNKALFLLSALLKVSWVGYYVIKDWANTATPNSFGQPHAKCKRLWT